MANATETPRRNRTTWMPVALVELAIGVLAVALDVFVPTLILLVLLTLSLVARGERLASLGVTRLSAPLQSALQILGLTVAWTLLQIGFVIPLLERATGTRQDFSDFAAVEGSISTLLVLLALSWTLAAIGEEFAYRGYLFTRVTDVVGTGVFGVAAATVLTSLLFGLAHTEQGLIGVCVTFLDALFFCWMRTRYRTVWAAVLAHGFNNTIGLIAFYFVGPVYGLW